VVGGGLGRTPRIGHVIRDFLPERHLLSYLEAILRVYNQLGRRDNIYKARIKILVDESGVAEFTRMVEAEWAEIKDGAVDLPADELTRIADYFAPPACADLDEDDGVDAAARAHPAFAAWLRANVAAHKVVGYAIANISLKPAGGIPGDASAEQMRAVADLAERYSFGEIRVAHEQNLVLPHVARTDLFALWQGLVAADLATANLGQIGDIIACPGLDYCSLATARSIPIAQAISDRFADPARQAEIGPLSLNISGCINACGHHHVGNIGILGVDKAGEEFYQITIGGRADLDAALGDLVGPAVPANGVPGAIEAIVDTYLGLRRPDERFVDTYGRVGIAPFKERLYGKAAA
jgi:sulfite reductase (NADPH) hemoprotein beta-component